MEKIEPVFDPVAEFRIDGRTGEGLKYQNVTLDPACGTCRFRWYRDYQMHCRRHSPGGHDGMFPRVRPQWWCGDHEYQA